MASKLVKGSAIILIGNIIFRIGGYVQRFIMATIQKRGKSYRITVSCGYDLEGKQIRASTTWTPDPDMTARQIEKEVNRQAVLFEEQVKTGAVSVNGNIRLKAFSERFLNDYARLYLKPTTIRNYERDLDRINAALGHVRLCDLKPAQITRFYASLMQEGSNQQNGGNNESHQFRDTYVHPWRQGQDEHKQTHRHH